MFMECKIKVQGSKSTVQLQLLINHKPHAHLGISI